MRRRAHCPQSLMRRRGRPVPVRAAGTRGGRREGVRSSPRSSWTNWENSHPLLFVKERMNIRVEELLILRQIILYQQKEYLTH